MGYHFWDEDIKRLWLCHGQCCSVIRTLALTLKGGRFDSWSRASPWVAGSIPHQSGCVQEASIDVSLSHSLLDFGPGGSRLHGMRQPCKEAHRTRPVNNYRPWKWSCPRNAFRWDCSPDWQLNYDSMTDWAGGTSSWTQKLQHNINDRMTYSLL